MLFYLYARKLFLLSVCDFAVCVAVFKSRVLIYREKIWACYNIVLLRDVFHISLVIGPRPAVLA